MGQVGSAYAATGSSTIYDDETGQWVEVLPGDIVIRGLTGEKAEIRAICGSVAYFEDNTSSNVSELKLVNEGVTHMRTMLRKMLRLLGESDRRSQFPERVRHMISSAIFNAHFRLSDGFDLDLSHQLISDEDAIVWSRILAEDCGGVVSSLNLSSNSIGGRGAVALGTCLAAHFNLKKLDLSRNNIEDAAKDFAPYLAVSELDLSGNRITNIESLPHMPHIVSLSLNFNPILSLSPSILASIQNVQILSLYGTRISSLWMTCRVLEGLPRLQHLIFQKRMPPQPPSAADSVSSDDEEAVLSAAFIAESRALEQRRLQRAALEEAIRAGRLPAYDPVPWGPAESVDDDMDIDGVSDTVPRQTHDVFGSPQVSPICHELFYRPYLIAKLKELVSLDEEVISATERSAACNLVAEKFQAHGFDRTYLPNTVSLLRARECGISLRKRGLGVRRVMPSRVVIEKEKREPNALPSRSCSTGACCGNQETVPHTDLQDGFGLGSGKSFCPREFTRTMGSVRASASHSPGTRIICPSKFRPRQFEFHPKTAGLMVLGTIHGEVVLLNHFTNSVLFQHRVTEGQSSVLGLTWLRNNPNKLISGNDNGSISLLDVSRKEDPIVATFEEFHHLTSVHGNSSDELMLVSGHSCDVGLYDIILGKKISTLKNLHGAHINVLKFAHHAPSLFATSSFDRDVKLWDLRIGTAEPVFCRKSNAGNIMVCFSHDDSHLLVSAVDNEVKQYSTTDGSLDISFDMKKLHSGQNYTRSYYLKDSEYIISGSCEENVARILSARTGAFFRDVPLGSFGPSSMYIQSLRGDPHRDFCFGVLVAFGYPLAPSQIIEVDLMRSP